KIAKGLKTVQGFAEGRGAFLLESKGESIDVDPRLGKAGQALLAVAAVRCERVADLAVIAEGLECPLRHGVHRERCSKLFHIERVGSLWVLCAGARPEHSLGASAGIGGTLEAR